jgi:hypothetical protein
MRHFLFFVCLFLSTYCLSAQEQTQISKDNSMSYIEVASNYASIFSGREEPRYLNKAINHPYLETNSFISGTISIDGCKYFNIPMRLNQMIEELVVLSPNNSYPVIVPRKFLDYAIIDSFYIVFHKPESADGRVLPEGYYVRMYNGENQVWKRNISFLISKTISSGNSMEYYFDNKKKMYIYMDGVYYPVKNKRSVLKLFTSKKKELKKIIKQSGLKYRENPEKATVAIAGYYDELNK